jgi:hypothetical protein
LISCLGQVQWLTHSTAATCITHTLRFPCPIHMLSVLPLRQPQVATLYSIEW